VQRDDSSGHLGCCRLLDKFQKACERLLRGLLERDSVQTGCPADRPYAPFARFRLCNVLHPVDVRQALVDRAEWQHTQMLCWQRLSLSGSQGPTS
jgi:hypothetical protein